MNTPIGKGPSSADNGFGKGGLASSGNGSQVTYSVHLGLACRLNTVAFAVSIIAALLFLCTAAMQVALVRQHKKEKRFGPSPSNNYTSGTGSRWGRKKGTTTMDAEAGDGLAPVQPDTRVSHETGYTGSTIGGPGYDSYNKAGTQAPTHGAHGMSFFAMEQVQGTC